MEGHIVCAGHRQEGGDGSFRASETDYMQMTKNDIRTKKQNKTRFMGIR